MGLCRGRDPGGREVATSRLSGPVAHQGYLRTPGRMRGLVRWSVWECMGGGWAWEAPARYGALHSERFYYTYVPSTLDPHVHRAERLL